jgi:hypothetical protein
MVLPDGFFFAAKPNIASISEHAEPAPPLARAIHDHHEPFSLIGCDVGAVGAGVAQCAWTDWTADR